MANTNIIHNCTECAAVKENLDIMVEDKDVEEYEEIKAGLSSANDMLSQYANYDKPIDANVLKNVLDVIHEKETEYKTKEQQWWRRIMNKYDISDKTKIDTNHNLFFRCLYKGNEVVDFVEKRK
jgi:hypothetical protein